MQGFGHWAGRLIAASRHRAAGLGPLAPWAALGGLAALLPALWMWNFTVDDALIAIRYARHLALGLGWRFNASGPSTDGVTPLPWPLVLAPFAHADGLLVLGRAKALGLAAWGVTGIALGAAVGRVERASVWARAAALSVLGLSVPLAAHAVSGMETALATALATFAVLLASRPRAGALVAGLAASLRPEMAVWACVLTAARALIPRRSFASPRALAVPSLASVASAVGLCGLALAPFTVCAVVRAACWGRPAPLALLAKPSDLAHGLAYAGAGWVVTLTPLLVLAPLALRRAPAALAIAVAAAAHGLAVVVVGGDWMPYARLMVPVAPSLAYAGVLVSTRAHPLATTARSLAGLALGAALLARGGTAGRRVGLDRAALVAAARPLLAGARRVAALDIGWVGAATEADIVDLAGLTDPDVAALPGGHTSKRVDPMFLLSRDPDALLLYARTSSRDGAPYGWADAAYTRAVEARLAGDPVIARHFIESAWLPLGTAGAGYVLLRRAP